MEKRTSSGKPVNTSSPPPTSGIQTSTYERAAKAGIFYSLKAKLLIFGFCISLIPIVIITTTSYFNARNALTRQIMQDLTVISEFKKAHILEFLEAKKGRTIDFCSDGFIRDSLEKINRGVSLRQDNVTALNRHLSMNKMPLDPHIVAIEVVDMNGKVAASTNETMIGRDVSDHEIYKRTILAAYNNPYVSQPYYSTYLDAKSIDIYVLITSKRGSKTIGVLINHYYATALSGFVANHTGLGKSGEVLLVRRDGENIEFLTPLRYVPDETTRSLTVPMDSNKFEVSRLALDGRSGALITADYRDIDVVAAYQYIPSMDWGLIAKIDKSEAFVALNTLGIIALILSVVSAATVTSVGIIFANAASRPIRRLTDATLRFAVGDLKVRIEATRRDEIGDLAKGFNAMACELEKEITGRKRKEMELRKVSLVVEQSPNVVLITDTHGNIEYVNPRFTLLTGYASEEVIGKNPRILNTGKTPPEVYKQLWETITSGSEWRGEFCNKKKNGELYWESAFISSIKNAAGDITHFIAIAEDITERKKIKRRLDTQYALTYILSEFNKFSESSGKILRSICECLGWDLGVIWICDIQAHVLKCVDIWHTPDRDFPEFKAISMQIEFAPGVGLPGSVWTSAKPVWIGDVVTDSNFPRALIASKDGLHSAFGFPITSGSEVLGVIEFFSHEIQPPDEDLLDMINNIGKQIGLFLTRKQTEEQLNKVSQAVEQSLSIVMMTDTKGNIEYVNPKFTKITGYFANEVIGKNPRILKSDKTPPELYKQLWETITSGSEWRGEFCNKKKNGELYWEYASISPIRNLEGIITNFLAVKEDFTERRQAEERIHQLAYYDSLTGLPNRVIYNDRLSLALAHAQRTEEMLAVLFLDLDRFKDINDTLGHSIGDQLLKTIAGMVKDSLRKEDTVTRLGGDEFMLLLPGMAQTEDVARIAQKILEAVKKPLMLGGHELNITASIGIAIYPADGEGAEALIKNSDTAMYHAKEQGRNNYQFFTAALQTRTIEQMEMESSLYYALEREEFIVYYQPQVDVKTGRIVGSEALLRWQHTERGLVNPAEFISIAERIGLIVPIGKWVLRTACAQNRAWQDAGLPPLSVAVNLSARQFQQENLVEMVALALKETGMDPRFLTLEITESVAMKNVEAVNYIMKRLSGLGVQLVIDDLGTGYSSLSYLKMFPIYALKIDRSFIQNVVTDSNDMAIVKLIISMAKELGLEVVAEGVETTAQLEFLRSLGCDEAQGYLFGKPVTAGEFKKILEQDKHL